MAASVVVASVDPSTAQVFRFYFARHRLFYNPCGNRPSPVQCVQVTAPSHREAWALFESLYRPKHYTAFRMERLSPNDRSH